jgi:hypothetical protein
VGGVPGREDPVAAESSDRRDRVEDALLAARRPLYEVLEDDIDEVEALEAWREWKTGEVMCP